jgi:hypothetical protein
MSAASTPDCEAARLLLDKRDLTARQTKRASDPMFNMVAQLVAAELNYAAGAYQCTKVTNAISAAEALLDKYDFTGLGYTGTLLPADVITLRDLANTLDLYNNNMDAACQ